MGDECGRDEDRTWKGLGCEILSHEGINETDLVCVLFKEERGVKSVRVSLGQGGSLMFSFNGHDKLVILSELRGLVTVAFVLSLGEDKSFEPCT